MVKIASYGTWTSPIDAAVVARSGRRPSWTSTHAGSVWWTESRPDEGGRLALMRHDGAGPVEVLAAPWNVRTRVHEYGGTPYVVIGDHVAFTNWDDQRVYAIPADGGEPTAITPEPDRHHGARYADLIAGGSDVWCVRETATGDRPVDVRRDLVAIPLTGEGPRVLAATHHFMTAPKPSPDGRHATWIGWEHPNMPWDGTELCVAEVLADGTFGPHRVVAGGPREAVCQVEWEDNDSLLALTDPDGWWNLHRIGLDGKAVNLAPVQQELGGALWVLGSRWFTPLGRGRHAVLRAGHLAILDERSGTVTDVDTDLPTWASDLSVADGVLTATAGGPVTELAVVSLDLSNGELTVLSEPSPGIPDERYLPKPVERTFRAADGRDIPAYVFAPTNPDYTAPEGELPPYLVHVHGGPTSAFTPLLSLSLAYFTSRGLGVVAVNHGGSTGNGREFRDVLLGQWGVVDVHDCATVAAALGAERTADPERLAVRGGSAGGWTAAASMTTVDTYACGAIHFPILDLTGWTSGGGETHDFESQYVEGLVGSLPEHADRYADRSPINHIDKLAGPVLLLQGLEDEVCPPEQADRFVAGLDGTGIPHAYLTFEGEQHGFRRAESIIAAHEAEVSFYGQVFGFDPPGLPVLELRR
ncbi:putative acyl-peptide hydrolase [Alloactinosynnema sp. L-07]|uniref:S9 family peptidase n=1 Tax=Alloactinosynnema sp. L-07 TaxID=1653480 RepID=UPI00065F0535|nr:prolyl oligopeptidase family serine peptidase [Alloactinosynnema sp. L-07]CRK57118.1 putative acyl-peptide hydrolase [Alloactinosynnema sp. L-07]